MKNKFFLFILLFVCVFGFYFIRNIEVETGFDVNYTLTNIEFAKDSFSKMSFYDIDADHILIDVWASWCKNCVAQNKEFNALFYYNPKIYVIAISLDKDSIHYDKSISFNKQNQIYHIRDSLGWESKYVQLFKFNDLPFNILVDKSFVILGKNLTPAEIKKIIEN